LHESNSSRRKSTRRTIRECIDVLLNYDVNVFETKVARQTIREYIDVLLNYDVNVSETKVDPFYDSRIHWRIT